MAETQSHLGRPEERRQWGTSATKLASRELSTEAAPQRARMVQAQSVSKRYGPVTAVDNVSFDLDAGQFLTILGPSGCGKTTLLRMMAGFLDLTEGHIHIAGQAVDKVPPYKRSIGMVFQRLALFQHMSVEENVAFPLRMRRFDPSEIPDRVDIYLKLVRMGGYQKRSIGALSGGQQQRVAIARSLVFEPTLLLLDEPLASLDRKLREEMQLEFRRIQRELGVTTINVTHDQREALVMSDKILVMNEGRLQQLDSPAGVYDRPSNKFVADFIGQTNFLRAEIVSNAGKVSLRLGGVTHQLSTEALGGFCGRKNIDCAVRAERIAIGAEAKKSPLRFKGKIIEIIFEGERIIYQVAVPQLGSSSLTVIGHEGRQPRALSEQDHVKIGWEESDMRFFSADN